MTRDDALTGAERHALFLMRDAIASGRGVALRELSPGLREVVKRLVARGLLRASRRGELRLP